MTAAVSTDSDARRWTTGYYLLFICLGLDIGVIGPTLPALAEQTGTPLGNMGLLFLVSAVGYTVGTLVGGRVMDRVPRGHHPALGIAQLVVAAMLLSVPLAPTFWILLVLVACKGIAEGMVNTGANILLLWTHGSRASPYMNGLHFFFGIGAFASPFLVAQTAAQSGGFRWAYWVLAGAALLVGIRLLTLAGNPRPAAQRNETGVTPRLSRAAGLVLISAMLYLFFYVGAEIAFGGWVYTYALLLQLAKPAGAAYLTSAFWLAFTVGRLVSIPIAVRFRPAPIVVSGLFGCLAILVPVIIWPNSPVVLWIVTVGLGFCLAPLWPTGFTMAGQALPLNGRMTALILLGDSVGAMVLPSIAGKVIEGVGPHAMIYLVFGSLVGSLAAFGAMLRWGRRTRLATA